MRPTPAVPPCCGACASIAKGNQTPTAATAPNQALLAAGARLTLCTVKMHAAMVEVMRWALATGRLGALPGVASNNQA
jgi:hypothetical protein